MKDALDNTIDNLDNTLNGKVAHRHKYKFLTKYKIVISITEYNQCSFFTLEFMVNKYEVYLELVAFLQRQHQFLAIISSEAKTRI